MLASLLGRLGLARRRPSEPPEEPDVSIDALNGLPRESIDAMTATSRDRSRRGIYAWYVNAKGRDILSQAKLEVRPDGLVYIGSTWTSFRERTAQHKNRGLRETLTCVLGAIDPRPCGGDVERFMLDHLRVAVMPRPIRKRRSSVLSAEFGWSPTQRRLRKEEHRLIKAAEPCLNRTSRTTANAKRITELFERTRAVATRRRSIRERATALVSLVGGLFRPDGRRPAVPGPISEARRAAMPPTRTPIANSHAEPSVQPAPSPRLTRLGRFRRDFWAHVSRRHAGEAPPGWASGNVYRRVDAAGRRVSQYVAWDGVGVFFPREPGESAAARTAAVRSSVRWLRAEIEDAQMTKSGWSFLKINSRDRRNWDRMADWLHDRRLVYERALRDTARTDS